VLLDRGEILFGIERLPHGRRRQELAERAMSALAEVPYESVPETVGDANGQIKAARQRQGLTLLYDIKTLGSVPIRRPVLRHALGRRPE
jgi:hypothetical protein